MIPQVSPAARMARFKAQIDDAVRSVVGGQSYILGPTVEAFEMAFAAYVGTRYCIGVNSGTDAIALALRALGIGEGDEVITSALTAGGTAQAILHAGATPRFVDVDPATYCIAPDAVAAAVTEGTAAILPVHLFGHPCDMGALSEIAARHELLIVEDCAQAHGARIGQQKVGSFGHAAAFSFYPTKNLGCIGDGGAVVTNDSKIAERVRRLRMYGFEANDQVCGSLGFNSRLDEMQAAILNVLLSALDASNAERRALATRYRARLGDLPLGLPGDDPGCVYHQFACTFDDRNGLKTWLGQNGVGTKVHYTPGLHQHPAFAAFPARSLPVTERLAATLLSLPIQPEIAADAVDTICESIAAYVRR